MQPRPAPGVASHCKSTKCAEWQFLPKKWPRVRGAPDTGSHKTTTETYPSHLGVCVVGVAHLVVEGCDEPQLHLQVGASLLGGNELQQVLVLHARCAEDFPFTLPRLLVLRQGGSSVPPLGAPRQHSHPTHPSPSQPNCKPLRWLAPAPGFTNGATNAK